MFDHIGDTGVPGGVRVWLVEEILQITARLDLDLVVDLVVDRQRRFGQLLLVQVEGALGILRLLLDLQRQVGGIFGLFPQPLVDAAKGGVVGPRRGEAHIHAKDVAPFAHLASTGAGIQHVQRHLRHQRAIGARPFCGAAAARRAKRGRAGQADHFQIAFGGRRAEGILGVGLRARDVVIALDIQVAQAGGNVMLGDFFALGGA